MTHVLLAEAEAELDAAAAFYDDKSPGLGDELIELQSSSERVVVLAVAHARRRPLHWIRRGV